MKYILIDEKKDIYEIKSRQKFLYDIFKMYTIPFYFDDYIELKSIPESTGNVTFIKGHNGQIYNYLKKKKLNDKNIVLITCYKGIIRKIKLKNKNVFFSDVTTNRLDGKQFGFNFEITNSELNLYNCSYESINDKINYSFERIK